MRGILLVSCVTNRYLVPLFHQVFLSLSLSRSIILCF